MLFRLTLLFLIFTSCSVGAQQSRIGFIEFYGLKTITPQQIQGVLGVKVGDSLISPLSDLENRIKNIPGVQQVNVSNICCEGGKGILYVGITEAESRPVLYRSLQPTINKNLPESIQEAYVTFFEALKQAVNQGDGAENFDAGHSLMQNAEARLAQERFIPLANLYFESLTDILQHSPQADDRKIAAHVLAYADDKQKVAKILNASVLDPNDEVRNAVVRAVAGLARYAHLHPEKKIRLDYKPLINLLKSVYWTDRNKALYALMGITEVDRSALEALKPAKEALKQMALWKTSHAMFPYFILGRMKGLSDGAIFEAWSSENREAAVRKWSK